VRIDFQVSDHTDVPRCFGKLYVSGSTPCRSCEHAGYCSKVEVIFPDPPPDAQKLPVRSISQLRILVEAEIRGVLRRKPFAAIDLIDFIGRKLGKGASFVKPVLTAMKRRGETHYFRTRAGWIWGLLRDGYPR